MNVQENAEGNTVTATFELPGLKKEDVQLEVHNNFLTVSGEIKETSKKEEKGYVVQERRFGKFSRTLQLPQGVRVSTITFQSMGDVDSIPRTMRLRLGWKMAF
jgi:HSP20 family protein